MTYKTGETVELNGKKYQVVEGMVSIDQEYYVAEGKTRVQVIVNGKVIKEWVVDTELLKVLEKGAGMYLGDEC